MDFKLTKQTTYEDPDYSDFELFKYIWTKPRSVFEFLQYHGYNRFTYVLLFLLGLSRGIDRVEGQNMGNEHSLFFILTVVVFMGGGIGLLSFYIYTAMLNWTGKWMGGKARTKALYRVLAFASVPASLFLLFQIPMIILYGKNYFQFDFLWEAPETLRTLIFLSSLVVQTILSGYTLVLLVVGVSVVQEISIGKAILNVLLPGIIFLGITILFIFIYLLSSGTLFS